MITYKLFAPIQSLHPLFYITLAYMLGICWAAQVCSFFLSCFFGCLIIGSSWLCSRFCINFYILMAGIVLSFFAGTFLYYSQQQQFNSWIHAFTEPVDIIATVTDIAPCSNKKYSYIITARIEKIHLADHTKHDPWQTAAYYLMIYTKIKPKLLTQDRIFLSSITISTPKREAWHNYALKHSIGGTSFCKKICYNLIERPYWSCKRWLWSIRQSFSQRLLQKMSHTTASFYSLLFMGTHHLDKKRSDIIRKSFQTWGILHYLARSGLHLVVFIMIWNFLLLIVPCSYRIRESLLLLLSIIYFLLSWPSLSFVRAFTMYIFYKISGLYLRSPHTLHVLTLVTLIFLIINPIHLFCLDFQLSFGLTFALAWLQNNSFIWKNSYLNP